MLDAAMDLDIVERRGSWYAFNGENLAQGRHNVVALLKSNPELAEQLELAVREGLDDMIKKPDYVEESGTAPPASSTVREESNIRGEEILE
mmetsp:Transcript_13719/g.17901  ORF Transcript_13719/g.17901 Transcript_13719/m.17901 type:complete len:91 (+) Transcript_13719:727-999(+)